MSPAKFELEDRLRHRSKKTDGWGSAAPLFGLKPAIGPARVWGVYLGVDMPIRAWSVFEKAETA